MRKFGPILAFLLTFATVGSAQLSKLTKGVGNLVSGVTGGAVTVDTQVGVTATPGGGVSAGVDAGVGVNVGGVSAGVDAGASASATPRGGVTAGVDASATTPGGGVTAGAGAGTGAPAGVLGKDDGQSSGQTGTTNVAAKISSDLLNIDPASSVHVIVQFIGTPTSEDLEKISAQGAVEAKPLQIVNGMSFSLTAGKLTEVAKESSVVYITRDRSVSAFLDYATDTVGASIAQGYGYSGAGIGVAVIDSGVYAHPDLKDSACAQSRIVYQESFVGDSQSGDPFGHGTHVAGIVGSNGACVDSGSTAQEFRGIAPNANIISLRC